jgi:hypothetical protein
MDTGFLYDKDPMLMAQLSVQSVLRLFPGDKSAGFGVHHQPPSRAEVKNE